MVRHDRSDRNVLEVDVLSWKLADVEFRRLVHRTLAVTFCIAQSAVEPIPVMACKRIQQVVSNFP